MLDNRLCCPPKGAWIKEQQIDIDGERIMSYRVNMLVTFILDD